MDYKKHYDRLVVKYGACKKPKGVYTERHRKLPGYLGGEYVSGNAFYMSARAHYVAHLLWAKITNHGDAWTAVKLMGEVLDRKSSRLYEVARIGHAKAVSEFMKGNQFALGYNHTEETKAKISASSRGRKRSPDSIAKGVTSNKATISAPGYVNPTKGRSRGPSPLRGRKQSAEHVANVIASLRGKGHGKIAGKRAVESGQLAKARELLRSNVEAVERHRLAMSEIGKRIGPTVGKNNLCAMVKCECGKVSNVGNIAKHQKSTGHTGKTRI